MFHSSKTPHPQSMPPDGVYSVQVPVVYIGDARGPRWVPPDKINLTSANFWLPLWPGQWVDLVLRALIAQLLLCVGWWLVLWLYRAHGDWMQHRHQSLQQESCSEHRVTIQPSTGIARLPKAVFPCVLQWLSDEDLARAAQVSGAWKVHVVETWRLRCRDVTWMSRTLGTLMPLVSRLWQLNDFAQNPPAWVNSVKCHVHYNQRRQRLDAQLTVLRQLVSQVCHRLIVVFCVRAFLTPSNWLPAGCVAASGCIFSALWRVEMNRGLVVSLLVHQLLHLRILLAGFTMYSLASAFIFYQTRFVLYIPWHWFTLRRRSTARRHQLIIPWFWSLMSLLIWWYTEADSWQRLMWVVVHQLLTKANAFHWLRVPERKWQSNDWF